MQLFCLGFLGCAVAERACLTESTSLIQQGFLVVEDAVSVGGGWPDIDISDLLNASSPLDRLDDLISSFDIGKITKSLKDVLDTDTSDMTPDEIQQKVGEFTRNFKAQVVEEIGEAQQAIVDFQNDAAEHLQVVRIQALSKITETVTNLAEGAMDVAQMMLDKITELKEQVIELVSQVQEASKNLGEGLQAKAQEAATTLEGHAQVLTGFVGQLKAAMNRVEDESEQKSSLLQLSNTAAAVIAGKRDQTDPETTEEPEVSTNESAQAAAEATLEEALSQAEAAGNAVLTQVEDCADTAATYVGFLNLTIREARENVLILTNETLNSTLPEETINATVQALTEFLQNANRMMAGEYDLEEAKKEVEQNSAAPLSTGLLLFVGSFLCIALS